MLILPLVLALLPHTHTPDPELLLGPRVALHVADMRTIADPDLIEDACDILRVRCRVTPITLADNPEPGSIAVVLTDFGPMPSPDGEGYILGMTVAGGSCMPVLWSDADPKVLAHELGHALGLPHTIESEDSLMFPVAMGGDDVSRDEHKTLRREARELSRC